MTTDRVRVLRLVEYEGPREWVERTVANSIKGTKIFQGSGSGECVIRAVVLGDYPTMVWRADVQAGNIKVPE